MAKYVLIIVSYKIAHHDKCMLKVHYSCLVIKGIVHLNIIFSYVKVNKICNLDYPVY